MDYKKKISLYHAMGIIDGLRLMITDENLDEGLKMIRTDIVAAINSEEK